MWGQDARNTESQRVACSFSVVGLVNSGSATGLTKLLWASRFLSLYYVVPVGLK